MKQTFDSRTLSQSAQAPQERALRPEAAVREGGGSALSHPAVRVVIMICIAAAALYLILGPFFVRCIVGTLVMAMQVLIVELLLWGLARHRRQGIQGGDERGARRSGWAIAAWCIEAALAAALLAGCAFWVYRSASGRSEGAVARADGGGDGFGAAAKRKASDRDVLLYVESTESEISQLFELVRHSSLVQENGQYAAFMKDVGFVFAATNDEVNAVASRRVGRDGKMVRTITCYAGEARFAKTIALAAAAELSGERGIVGKMMEKMTPRLCFRLGVKDSVGLIRECGLDRFILDDAVRAKAKSIAAGGIVGTLAHEVGHQVLGHNFQEGKDCLNNEVRRNFESQADLFAASVMSSSPFGEYVFAGRVFALWVSMRQTDPLLEKIPARELDHPINKERFIALVMANKEKATALGIKIPEM